MWRYRGTGSFVCGGVGDDERSLSVRGMDDVDDDDDVASRFSSFSLVSAIRPVSSIIHGRHASHYGYYYLLLFPPHPLVSSSHCQSLPLLDEERRDEHVLGIAAT